MANCTVAATYSNKTSSAVNTLTVSSVVVSAGQSLLVQALYNPSSGTTISSANWNTSEGFTVVSGLVRTYMLAAPTAGTHSVVVNFSGSPTGGMTVLVHVLDNYGSVRGVATGTTATLTQALTTVSGDLCLAWLTETFGDTNDLAPASGCTSLWSDMTGTTGSGAIDGFAVSIAATTTSTTIGWSVVTQDANRSRKSEYLAIIGAAAGTTNTFYLLDTAASSSSHGQLQIDGSAPTAATTTTGWTVGSSAVDTYSLLAYGTERASSTFAGTAQPASAPGTTDCWRSASTITGQYAAGDWDFSFALRAVDQGGTQDGAIRVRLWRSTDPTGAGATEITSGATQLSTMTNIATGADSTSTGTITLGAVTLAAEYLFCQVAWRVTGAA